MHSQKGSKGSHLSYDPPINSPSSSLQSITGRCDTPGEEKFSTETLNVCDSARELSEGFFAGNLQNSLNPQTSSELPGAIKDEMLQELTKLLNEIDIMLVGDICIKEPQDMSHLESLCLKYKKLADEFELKYRNVKLQNASLELSILYAERDNQKRKSLNELHEEDKLIKLSEERKINLADAKELSAQNLRFIDILSNLRSFLGRLETKLRSNATKTVSVSAREVYEKLGAVTQNLSNSIEQNKVLHRALKSAKDRILLQNVQLAAYKNLLENPSHQNNLKKRIEDLEKELHETRIIARKEQELMVTALSMMYDKLVAPNKISGNA